MQQYILLYSLKWIPNHFYFKYQIRSTRNKLEYDKSVIVPYAHTYLVWWAAIEIYHSVSNIYQWMTICRKLLRHNVIDCTTWLCTFYFNSLIEIKWWCFKMNILHKMHLIKEYSDIYEINYYKETIKIRTKTHLQLFWTVIMQELHSSTLVWIR